ncbi:processed acidic surface protein [Bacillus sp. FJAT-27251]|uniref:processed acidic surface protein n=1 Tax=Bacillus sp. FJAT-27251 TaxID=1684142 RepID=UPI0006A7B694|nr:processed acidic surface protein [Bacillus sp. FJAT-27251]
MKRLLAVVLSLALSVVLFPLSSFAALSEADVKPILDENGWELEDLESHLDYFHFSSLEEFETYEELRETLGDKINDQNLQQLIEEYGFETKQDLVDFLIENDELEEGTTIEEQFVYINSLDETVLFYYEPEFDMEDMEDLEGLDEIFAMIGLTDEEMERLFLHFDDLNLSDPNLNTEAQMEELEARLDAIGVFESASELSEAQLNELVSIFEEMMAIFKLDAKYYLVDGDSKTPITTSELIRLEDTEGRDLLIELYNLQGEFLADILITADLFASDLVEDVTAPVKAVKDTVGKKAESSKSGNGQPKTVKGAKLPNTAGNYVEGILMGFVLAGAGFYLLRRRSAHR